MLVGGRFSARRAQPGAAPAPAARLELLGGSLTTNGELRVRIPLS